MDEMTKIVVQTVLSGVFGLLTAAVPVYLQKRKPKERSIRDLAAGKSGLHYVLAGLFVFAGALFWSGLLTVLTVLPAGLVIGQGPSTDAGGQLVAIFRDDGSLVKIPVAEFWDLLPRESYVFELLGVMVDVLLIVAMFLLGRYVGRRSDRFGAPALVVGILAAHAAVEVSNRLSEAGSHLDYGIQYRLLFELLHLGAGLAGYAWARRHRGEYFLGRIFHRLDPEDRQALFDLAQGVVETSAPRVAATRG